MSEYFFPTPGRALRSLLDRKARKGEEFTEEEAVMDVMLALDRGDLRPQRYYAKRWKWSKGRTSRALNTKRSDNLQARARRWRRFGKDEKPPKPGEGGNEGQAGRQWGAGGAPVGRKRGTNGAQLGRKSASESREGGGLGRGWGTDGAQVGQLRGAGGAQVGQYSTEADTYSDTKEKQQQTEEGRAREGASGESSSAAADSENELGLLEEEKEVARSLYRAGVTNPSGGRKGGAALELVVEHGAEAVRKQLRNLSLRQERGFQPDQGTGPWLVSAIRNGYELPSEKKASRDGREQKHRPAPAHGDGRAGPPPRHRGRPTPPEHASGAPSKPEPPADPMSEDVAAEVEAVLQQCSQDDARRQVEKRDLRHRRFRAAKRERFWVAVRAGAFDVEELTSATLLQPRFNN